MILQQFMRKKIWRFQLTSNSTLTNTLTFIKKVMQGFPGGAVVKNPPANAGEMGSSPGLGRSHMPRSS